MTTGGTRPPRRATSDCAPLLSARARADGAGMSGARRWLARAAAHAADWRRARVHVAAALASARARPLPLSDWHSYALHAHVCLRLGDSEAAAAQYHLEALRGLESIAGQLEGAEARCCFERYCFESYRVEGYCLERPGEAPGDATASAAPTGWRATTSVRRPRVSPETHRPAQRQARGGLGFEAPLGWVERQRC
jgi:hypothetical protein